MSGHKLSNNKWEQIFGPISSSIYNDKQLQELLEGLELSLPVQLYADPLLSAEQMRNIRTMLDTAFYAMLNPKDRITCTDYGPEELTQGFKSWSNFEKYPERICYIPENWDFETDGDGYSGQDILDLCDGDPIKARMIFSLCSWQHPSTVLGEWDSDDDFALLEAHREEAAKRIHSKSGLPLSVCRERVSVFTHDDLLRGYYLKTSQGQKGIPEGTKYIENIYQLMKYDTPEAAAKQAEKDGIRIIHDLPGIDDWTYLDTPQNRRILTNHLKNNTNTLTELIYDSERQKKLVKPRPHNKTLYPER